jgi:amidase
MPPGYCCQDIFLTANATHGTTSSAYLSALTRLRFLSRDNGIAFATKKYNLDVLVVPADSPRSTALSALSGWPIATVPVGVLKSGRPFGLAVFTSGADGRGEERLMRVLGRWWQAVGERPVPEGL